MIPTTRSIVLGLLLMLPIASPLGAQGAAVPPAVQGATAPKKPCEEGRTLAGECVSSGLAARMRERTQVFSQPLFSYTAPARLPSGDSGAKPETHIRDLATHNSGTVIVP